jgi:predicted ribosome-associated RNA-binding protein Tma20
MIDSGATGNFLSHKFTSSNDLAIQKKKAPYELIVIDGSPLSTKDGRVDRETIPLLVAIQKHYKELTFDIV